MSIFSKFEDGMDNFVDNAAGALFKSPIEPSQIAKKCEKQMTRNKLIGNGMQFAPNLYTVFVNVKDDQRLFGFYPTLAGELETFLVGKAEDEGLSLECRPLVRFIADDRLKKGKFDVVADIVDANIIDELRIEEAEYYGLNSKKQGSSQRASQYDRNADPNMQRGGQRRQIVGRSALDIGRSEGAYEAGVDAAGAAGAGGVAGAGAGAMAGAGAVAGAAGAGIVGAAGAAGVAGVAAEVASGAPSNAGTDVGADVGSPRAQASSIEARRALSELDSYDEYEASYDAGNNPTRMVGQQYGFQRSSLVNVRTGQIYPLEYDIVMLGRKSTCDIVLEDSSVSREHAQFEMDQMGNWSVFDLGSANGTLVNNVRVNSSPIQYGDQLTFGTTILQFRKG